MLALPAQLKATWLVLQFLRDRRSAFCFVVKRNLISFGMGATAKDTVNRIRKATVIMFIALPGEIFMSMSLAGGGVGGTPKNIWWDVWPASQNPIYDQNLRFSMPCFRPALTGSKIKSNIEPCFCLLSSVLVRRRGCNGGWNNQSHIA